MDGKKEKTKKVRRRSPTTDARPPKTDRHHRPAAKRAQGLRWSVLGLASGLLDEQETGVCTLVPMRFWEATGLLRFASACDSMKEIS